jgi:electron transfer flavoprotein beta subunit
MRIVVLVKMSKVIRGNPCRAENLEAILNEKNLASEVNSYDLAALEEAQQLKELYGDVHITAVTAGPATMVKALRVAHGMGADELIWVDAPAFEGGQEMELARLLARVVSERGFDLVLCGLKSDDVGTGFVGIGLAGLLGIPAVTRSVNIGLQPGNRLLKVERHVGKGNREVVQCPLPAVVVVERSRQSPRNPGMARYLIALKKITKYEVNLQPVKQVPVVHLETKKAQPRPKKIFTPDENLSAADRMKLIMTGGMARKKKKKAQSEVSGSEQLYNFLLKHGFIEK